MIVHKCDRCGREMNSWMVFETDFDYRGDAKDVPDFIVNYNNSNKYEFCPSCSELVLKELNIKMPYRTRLEPY